MAELVDRLIELAMERKTDRDHTSHTFRSRAMSDNREPTRAELVRMRREQEYTEQLQRVSKVTARPAHVVTTRARKDAYKARSQTCAECAPPLPDRHPHAARGCSLLHIPRPRFGMRLLSFILTAVLGTALYLAFTRPELRVTEAQLTGNQMLTQAEMNSALNVCRTAIFVLMPSDLERRLRLAYPELASVRSDRFPAQPCLCQRDRAATRHPLGAGWRLHLDHGGRHRLPSAEANWLD
ncbi:MAG: hypothetical protein M0C28_44515 [Candidatus Moduliflexus flocculans]|nr:hypothetical protein [Candidatus Moduliflexus flocculans]